MSNFTNHFNNIKSSKNFEIKLSITTKILTTKVASYNLKISEYHKLKNL